MDDASKVILSLLRTLVNWQEHDVLVHEVWSDSPTSACVVYEHTAGDLGPLGYRVTFPPHPVTNDPSSTGEAWALGLIEPVGALTKGIQRDRFGSPASIMAVICQRHRHGGQTKIRTRMKWTSNRR